MKRVILVHGWAMPPHWFAWLMGQLDARGYKVVAPQLPHPLNPQLDEWLASVREAIGEVDDAIIVSHSLGSCAVAHLLQETQGHAKAWIAVAPLVLPRHALFPTFFKQPLNGTLIREHTTRIVTFHDPADRWAPFSSSVFLREACGATLIEKPGRNHFNYLDKILEVPEILDVILSLE